MTQVIRHVLCDVIRCRLAQTEKYCAVVIVIVNYSCNCSRASSGVEGGGDAGVHSSPVIHAAGPCVQVMLCDVAHVTVRARAAACSA